MHLLTIPPGGRAKAHMHESHETAIYVLSGEATPGTATAGEPHRRQGGRHVLHPRRRAASAANLSDKPASAVIARTDPNEQESVVLLPELDALVPL